MDQNLHAEARSAPRAAKVRQKALQREQTIIVRAAAAAADPSEYAYSIIWLYLIVFRGILWYLVVFGCIYWYLDVFCYLVVFGSIWLYFVVFCCILWYLVVFGCILGYLVVVVGIW